MLKNSLNLPIILKIIGISLSVALAIVMLIWIYQNYLFLSVNSGTLSAYQLVKKIKIEPSSGEKIRQSSGLTYDNQNQLLYLIVNEPPQILVLSAQGDYLKTIQLVGFDDTEGITFLGDQKFAVVLEARALIAWFEIMPDTESVHLKLQNTLKLSATDFGNTGIEGITYAQKSKQLFVVKERKPQVIYQIDDLLSKQPSSISHPWNPEHLLLWFVRNLSGVYFDQKSQHLFILSRRSLRVIEYTLTGDVVGSFALKTGSALIHQPIRHAEGIVMTDDGTLYICAEPNDLYIFKKRHSQ